MKKVIEVRSKPGTPLEGKNMKKKAKPMEPWDEDQWPLRRTEEIDLDELEDRYLKWILRRTLEIEDFE